MSMKEAKRKIRSAVLVVFLIITAFAVPTMANNVSAEPEPTPIDSALMSENTNESYVPGEVIVGFHDSIPEDVDMLVAQYGGVLISRNDVLNFVLVKQEANTDCFISSINCHPSVAYAERNNKVYLTQFPNDPAFWNPIETGNPYSQQWGLRFEWSMAWNAEPGL